MLNFRIVHWRWTWNLTFAPHWWVVFAMPQWQLLILGGESSQEGWFPSEGSHSLTISYISCKKSSWLVSSSKRFEVYENRKAWKSLRHRVMCAWDFFIVFTAGYVALHCWNGGAKMEDGRRREEHARLYLFAWWQSTCCPIVPRSPSPIYLLPFWYLPRSLSYPGFAAFRYGTWSLLFSSCSLQALLSSFCAYPCLPIKYVLPSPYSEINVGNAREAYKLFSASLQNTFAWIYKNLGKGSWARLLEIFGRINYRLKGFRTIRIWRFAYV